MMLLRAPIKHLNRMKCECYGPEGLAYTMATSLDGTYAFEVEDFITHVVYLVCDPGNRVTGAPWVWDGQWQSADEPAGAELLRRVRNPKPAEISPALWAAAELYTNEFNKKWRATKKAFKKVTR